MTKPKPKKPGSPAPAAAHAAPAKVYPGAMDKIAPKEVIALMLWQRRHVNPSLSITITDREKKALEECLAYLGVEAEVGILRRGNKVIVGLVEKGTSTLQDDGTGGMGNAIKPIENNEADNALATEARNIVQLRAAAPGLAQQILLDMRNRTMSDDTMREAASTIQALARVQ